MATNQQLSGLFYFYNKKFQAALGNDIDPEPNLCNSEGMTLLRTHILKHCRSLEDHEALFKNAKEIPTEFAQDLPILTLTFDKLQIKFEG